MSGETVKREENFFFKKVETVQRSLEELSLQGTDALLHPSDEFAERFQVAIEELQIAEEQLRHQHEALVAAHQMAEVERQRYQELFEFAPDAYLVTGVDSTIREANRTAATLLNIDQKFLIGKPLSSFVPEEQRRSFRYMLNQLQTVNRVQEWELKLEGRGEKEFDAAITVEAVRSTEGKIVALRWLVRDITMRKQAEEQFRQIQLQNLQLLEADRVKSQFMATMSHELRTPMNAILGFSDLLRRSPQLDSNHVSMIERIFRNGRHLLSLIEEILDFTRLRANHIELKLTSFDLVELIVKTVEELSSLAEQKNLELQVHLPPQLLVVSDATRLQQIIINLLSNAIKFTNQGYVCIEAQELPEDRVALTIRDTGIGIDYTHQTKIFQEFWQVNQNSTRAHGGTGLGLSITAVLVHLMQGRISVESEINRGSTFRVELPRYLPNDISQQPSSTLLR